MPFLQFPGQWYIDRQVQREAAFRAWCGAALFLLLDAAM